MKFARHILSDLSRAVVPLLIVGLAVGLAGTSPVSAQCSADPYADRVLASSPTTGDPSWVLGRPDRLATDFENDYNDPGFVIVEFVGDVIVDGPGPDFAIHVIDFPAVEFVETFELLVSEDGSSWTSLGTVAPTNAYQDRPEQLKFDLQPFGVSAVRQIKILNTTVDTVHYSEGVDLDAFQALNCGSMTDLDLIQCENDLDACSSTLVTCDRELDDCNVALDNAEAECESALGAAAGAQADCEAALGSAQAEMDEVAAGLDEIRRLVHLPPGQRSSEFACSGELCPGLMAIIDSLLDPPGQNVKKGHGRR